MKNLLAFVGILCLFISCSKDDSNPFTSQQNAAQEFVGIYHGQDMEARAYNSGPNTDFSYPATVEVEYVNSTSLKITLILCHETDGPLIFDLEGTVDPQNEEMFTIEDEPFVGNIVNGQKITIEDGTAEFSSTQKSLELKFKEMRTFLNVDPDSVDLEYISTHRIETSQVDTGDSGC
jgi:hypothetical protein